MQDYYLTNSEKLELIKTLKKLKFDNFKISRHFFNKFNLPRHGVSLEEAKNIFYKFEEISDIFTRDRFGGRRYSIIYKMNSKKNYYLILLLDENPIQLFDAYVYRGDIKKRLFKKFFGY
jgi:uncharacterized DUF497 family protein